MKKILFILCVLFLFSCKKETVNPVETNKTETVIVNPIKNIDSNFVGSTEVLNEEIDSNEFCDGDPIIIPTDPIVVIPTEPTTMNIKFLLNPWTSENESFEFVVKDANTSLTLFTFKKEGDIIGVNTEEWACHPIHVPMVVTDNSYNSQKTYHYSMFVTRDSIVQLGKITKAIKITEKSHDFTFKVNANGNVTNLVTTRCNDIDLMCNKLILNYRNQVIN